MEAATIEQYISALLPCQLINVTGDGNHWQAIIVSDKFEGLTRIARQQAVYKTVQARLESNEIHALSLKTYTPAEWSAQNG